MDTINTIDHILGIKTKESTKEIILDKSYRLRQRMIDNNCSENTINQLNKLIEIIQIHNEIKEWHIQKCELNLQTIIRQMNRV